MGFEPTIPAFERAKTVHALGRAATVIGRRSNYPSYLYKYVDFIENVYDVYLLIELYVLSKSAKYLMYWTSVAPFYFNYWPDAEYLIKRWFITSNSTYRDDPQ
jgi:hypothetical protein